MIKQSGFNLLNSLMALLVFTFGMLSLASGYLKVNANLGDNEYFITAGVLAESLRSTLSASPSLLADMNGFSSLTYQTTPTTPLVDWVQQLKAGLPQGFATSTAVDPSGANCTVSLPCTVTLTINWQKKIAHSQTFVVQVGY